MTLMPRTAIEACPDSRPNGNAAGQQGCARKTVPIDPSALHSHRGASYGTPGRLVCTVSVSVSVSEGRGPLAEVVEPDGPTSARWPFGGGSPLSGPWLGPRAAVHPIIAAGTPGGKVTLLNCLAGRPPAGAQAS